MIDGVVKWKLSEKALPCPFCGGAEVLTYKYQHSAGIRYGIMCAGCIASIDPGWAQTRETVVDMWNKRAKIDVHIENTGTVNIG